MRFFEELFGFDSEHYYSLSLRALLDQLSNREPVAEDSN